MDYTEYKTDHDLLITIANDVARMVQLVEGNGKKGLMDRVSSLEIWRGVVLGVLGFVSAVGYWAYKIGIH